MSSPDFFFPADLTTLVKPSSRYEAVSVQQTQELAGTTLVDALDIAYIISGRPGVFSLQLPLRGGATLIATGNIYVPGTGAGYSGQYDIVGQGIDLSPYVDVIEGIYAIAV